MERPVSLWEKMNSNCFHRLDVSNSEGSSSKPSPMAALFVPQNKGTGVALKQQQPPPPPPPPRCQVEGCNVDLSGVKAYYCKHKVCGMHSKSPKVIVAGMEQRFCQQCSRFHQLHEFDLGKRSCRKRLACHNERRRKPSLGNPGRMSSTVHGENSRFRGILVDFTRPKLSALPKESWQRGPLNDHAQNYENQSGSGIPSLVGDSNCVLSLLSTEPWENTNCSIDGAQVPTHVSETLSKNMANSWGLYSAIEGSQFAGELELIIEGKRHCMGLELSGRGRSCDGVFHWLPY